MITHDIQRFSNHLAAIYSNLAKPTLDVILYNYQLSRNVGAEGLVLLTVLVQSSAALRKSPSFWLPSIRAKRHIVKALTPSFGAYAATSAQLSGSLRHTHSRLVEFSEEVAFFGGEETEKMLLEREYAGVIKHENMVLGKRWWHGCVEEGIIKWVWGSFGVSAIVPPSVCSTHTSLLQLCICAIPVFFKLPGVHSLDLGTRTEGFVTNRRLLLSSSGMSYPV